MAIPALRRLAQAATTPLLPADYLDVFAPLHGSTLRARVVDVRQETADCSTIELRPGAGWRGHTPGQFLRLGVDIDGVRHWRSYSITSTPQEHHVTITVKRQGLVSNHLTCVSRGHLVTLDQAAGEFTMPDRSAKALFVTAGSGITAVMSLLRGHAPDDVVVVHSAKTPDEVIFGEELRRLAAQAAIRLIEQHTTQMGRLDPADILSLVPDAAQRQTWVCGPNDLIDDMAAFFAQQGWPAPTSERFRPALTTVGQGGSVRFDRCGVEAQAAGDTPLLEVGEAAGVLLPSGCRMGICYGCVTPLREGSVRDLRDGTVTTADHEPVLIQTCINAAAGVAVLDA